jgi:hypothetical protein
LKTWYLFKTDFSFSDPIDFPPLLHTFKMSSIKQLIINAIIKVSQANPTFDREGGPTHEEARDNFIRLLVAELFPEDSSVVIPVVPKPEVVVPTEPAPEKKKRAPAKPKKPVSPPPVLETSAAAAGGAAPVVAEPEPEPAKEKKTRKPKPAADANLAKIDPTWRKHLKNADKDNAKELEPELLTYLNALSKEEFNAKKAEEHIADFVAARKPKAAEPEKVEADLDVVEFNGKEYYVNPETKRVYEGEGECDAEGNWTNYKGVGYVGMAAFADMKL